MFELLKNQYLQDREGTKTKTLFFINHGFMESWSDENKKESDDGLKRYSTDTRWNQYKTGKISREKAVELAQKRYTKQLEKETLDTLARVDKIAAAPDLQFIAINVIYKYNSYWGWNPTAETRTNNGFTTGRASGCGYDKESAAVAESFNQNDSILKALYTIKENGLKAELTSDSKTACTGHDNRNICGYGSGYSVLPYFEGGVGVGCFWDILKKAGFTTACQYGKHENYYTVSKMEV